MTGKRLAIKYLGALVLIASYAAACSRKPTVVHVKNESAFELKEAVLSGSGFRVDTPFIPAGGVADFAILSRGESGLAVSFVAQGRAVSKPEQGYFEGGGDYEGNVVIGPDLSVSVEFRLAGYRHVVGRAKIHMPRLFCFQPHKPAL